MSGTSSAELLALVYQTLQEYSYLLVARGSKGPYSFTHRLFQEYLAARALIECDDDELRRRLLAFRHQTHWHTTLQLVFEQLLIRGRPQRISELVVALLDADSESSPDQLQGALLLGQIARDMKGSPGVIGLTLYERITRRLTILIQRGRIPFLSCLGVLDVLEQIQPVTQGEELLAQALAAGAAIADLIQNRLTLESLGAERLIRVLYAFLQYGEISGDAGRRDQVREYLCAALPPDILQPLRSSLTISEFLIAAGFKLRYSGDHNLLATSDALLWRDFSPLYVRLVLDRALDLSEFLALRLEALQIYQGRLNGRVAAAVIDRAPSGGDLLQIYALQAQENFTVVPLELAQICAAQGRERRELRDQIDTYVHRDDLYSVRKPVTSVLSFFGRNPLLAGLKNRLCAGRSLMIVGVRRIGKTSLISRLREDSDWPVAQLDLTGRDSLESVLAEAIERWRAVLKLPTLDAPPRAEGFRRVVLELLTNMPEEQGLVLVLDEMDSLLSHDTYLEFAAALKSTAQDVLCRGRFAIVMAGLDLTLNHSDRLVGGHNPFYEFFEIERLGMLSPDDTRQMIVRIGGLMGIKYTSGALEILGDMGGGHPFLTRELCHRVVQRLGQSRLKEQLITIEQALAAIDSYLRDTGNYLRQSLWEYASGTERQLLQLLASREHLSEVELFPVELASDVIEQRTVALDRLRDLSLIAEDEYGWRLTVPLYRRWISSRSVATSHSAVVDGRS